MPAENLVPNLPADQDATAGGLRAGEARFTHLIYNNPDGVLVLDQAGVILFVNPAAAAMFGRPAVALVGQVLGFPVVLGEASEIDLVTTTGAMVAEMRVVETAWHGRSAHLLMLRDVTERKRLERALRVSEERLRFALDATSEGVWDWNIVTGDVEGGNRWFELLGYAPDEAPPTKRLWEDTLHADDAADTFRVLADYLEGRAPAYHSEHRIITKSGEVRWHLGRGKVVAWDNAGKPVRMVGTNADITERKIAEQRLRDSEERLRLVMQNSPDMIAVWDDRGMIEYLSPALERTVGSVQAEIVRHEGLLPLVAEVGCSNEVTAAQLAALGMDPLSVENWLKMRDAVCYGIDHPGETVRVEYQQRIDSGELRDLEAVYQGFVRSDSGHEVVAITRDITEHKALQRLLHQANADLEERVAARTAELAATVSELHRANAGKDAFMAAVSHELRTPLVGILGMGELLQTQARGPLNPDQERYVAWIRESGERLLETVNSVLRYTSLMAERAPVKREPCRLLELCASSVRTVKARAERKRQSIALDVTPADLMIVANTQGIINIVTTLLDNAVKFTPEDGAIGVEVRRATDVDAVRLVVWDTGIGMTAEQVTALFRPFSQADQGLTRQFAGTGIGLAYVSKMVEMLGGAIAVESAPGAGSRFMVTLPAAADSLRPENP